MAQYQIMRVSDLAAGPRQRFPVVEKPFYISKDTAIDEAIRLNETQDRRKHSDYYVVFVDGKPCWSPDEQTASWVVAAE